jgi:hypothetical protein
MLHKVRAWIFSETGREDVDYVVFQSERNYVTVQFDLDQEIAAIEHGVYAESLAQVKTGELVKRGDGYEAFLENHACSVEHYLSHLGYVLRCGAFENQLVTS